MTADLEKRVRRLERQMLLVSRIVMVLGDQVNATAPPADVDRRYRELTAEASELGADIAFDAAEPGASS